MLDKQHKRVPYPPLKTILSLPFLRTRNIWVDSHPCTWENRDNAAPNNVPYTTTMGEVIARVWLEWTTGDRWNRVGTDRKGQVVQKYEEKHFEGWVKDLLTGHPLSENGGAVEGSVSTWAVNVIIVNGLRTLSLPYLSRSDKEIF